MLFLPQVSIVQVCETTHLDLMEMRALWHRTPIEVHGPTAARHLLDAKARILERRISARAKRGIYAYAPAQRVDEHGVPNVIARKEPQKILLSVPSQMRQWWGHSGDRLPEGAPVVGIELPLFVVDSLTG
jgi:hypothetical protein